MFEVLKGGFEPVRGTKYSAYVDLFSVEDVIIEAGKTKIVKLGVKIDLDKLKSNWINKSGLIFEPIEAKKTLIEFGFNHFLKSHYLEIALRSSLGAKGLIMANGIGIIDLDYPDEIGLIVHNPIESLQRVFSVNDYYLYLKGKGDINTVPNNDMNTGAFKISKGDKVAQCTLKEHKGFLLGYESDVVRISGFGSTGK